MPDLGRVERVVLDEADLRRVENMCLCPGCPAYPEEDRGQKKAYCLRGDSPHKSAIDPQNCLCEMCEVYKHGKLYGSNYFCMTGAALSKGLRNVLKGEPITTLATQKRRVAPTLFVSAGLDVHVRSEETVTPPATEAAPPAQQEYERNQ